MPQPGGGGPLCTAEGVFEVCGGGYCRDRLASSMGSGATRAEAELAAVQECSGHMTRLIIIQNMNNRAARKRGCRVTRCS